MNALGAFLIVKPPDWLARFLFLKPWLKMLEKFFWGTWLAGPCDARGCSHGLLDFEGTGHAGTPVLAYVASQSNVLCCDWLQTRLGAGHSGSEGVRAGQRNAAVALMQ